MASPEVRQWRNSFRVLRENCFQHRVRPSVTKWIKYEDRKRTFQTFKIQKVYPHASILRIHWRMYATETRASTKVKKHMRTGNRASRARPKDPWEGWDRQSQDCIKPSCLAGLRSNSQLGLEQVQSFQKNFSKDKIGRMANIFEHREIYTSRGELRLKVVLTLWRLSH